MRYKRKHKPGDAAKLLRDARRAAGLTQTELAREANVTQPVIAAYESGSREPSVPMLDRLIAASGNKLVLRFEPDSDAYRIHNLAADIKHETSDDKRLRLVFEFLRSAKDDGHPLRTLVATPPPGTGDVRFDVMLAAVAEHLCVQARVPTPRWAAAPRRFLDHAWWVSNLPSARRRALVHTPASFRRRGIMIDRHDFESA